MRVFTDVKGPSEVYRLSKNFHLDVSLFERLIHNGAAHVTSTSISVSRDCKEIKWLWQHKPSYDFYSCAQIQGDSSSTATYASKDLETHQAVRV